MRVSGLLTAAVLCGLAWPAAAQPDTAADPIGALLERAGRATPELEEPDTAAEPPAPYEPDATRLPDGPQPYTPPPRRPQLTAPTYVDEVGRSPDAPPGLRDLAYESRLRASFASAQGFLGPLDGSWTLAARDGGDLYALELADRGKGVVEGAWRDLRRIRALEGSGFVDEITRVGRELILRFRAGADEALVTATLRTAGDGLWSGELVEQGARRPVVLRRAR